MKKHDIAQWKCRYRLEKREGDIDACKTPEERLAFLRDTIPYEVREGEGNCLLNTGIDEIWALVKGTSENPFGISGASSIGVGSDVTEADPTDTDLKDVSPTYKTMESGFPSIADQAISFKASFGDAEANEAWNEWVVKQPTSGKCLNRKVESLGTKTTGTWTLEVSITLE